MISGEAMKAVMETVERLTAEKFMREAYARDREIEELQEWKRRAESRSFEISALKATIAELQAAVKATGPAKGTWAWACEQMANDKRVYRFGWSQGIYFWFDQWGVMCVHSSSGSSVAAVGIGDVEATDWREVEG